VSHVGLVRENNEDNFFLNGKILPEGETKMVVECDESSDEGLFAVCDGMGGGVHGEVASAIAVHILKDTYMKMHLQEESTDELMAGYTRDANERICDEIGKFSSRRMGTTFVVATVIEDTVCVYNLGDSRAYLKWGNNFTQVSQDHTQVRSLVNMGVITEESAKTHPGRHTLTQHLGIFPDEMEIVPYAAPSFKLLDGDTLLLCSDGLTDMLDASEIDAILGMDSGMREMAGELVNAALKNGGKDNITVIVIRKE